MNSQELEQAFNETTDNAVKLLEENKDLKNKIKKAKQEIEKLNNKLSLIKGIIRTPRALDKSLAYAMVKTQIEFVLGSDKK